MKIFKSSWGLFTLAFILLLGTNAVVLTGVYLNRTIEITSHTVLTQRELHTPYKNKKENNGVSLRLVYRTLNSDKSQGSYYKAPSWLNASKLRELGFNTDAHLSSINRKKTAPKEVFIVLENDGEAYKKSLTLAEANFWQKEILFNANKDDKRVKQNYEDAKKLLNREQTSESRLFAVDAGLEYEKLRQIYSDKNKYIIVKGLVNKAYQYKIGQEQYGSVQQLDVQKIHLPYKFKYVLKGSTPDNYLNNPADNIQKYEVEIKYGSRYEPWISSVKIIL